ncbi:MAG: Fumarylacetoacetate hydrolase [Verrucomicrobiales bacterium]|nr:Fumarylacetoacetate hydrolase [Verrucomicrobiales bacterium]
MFKLVRFTNPKGKVAVGLVVSETEMIDLTDAGITRMTSILESEDPVARLRNVVTDGVDRIKIESVHLLPPVEDQEVWAAGVTYLRSKKARMEESDFSASAYDKVYDAPRPEIFFKSVPSRVVGTGDKVGIRMDAKWNVPEPELALVFNSRRDLVGYTICNDMSSRDIEGENLLYLPQAKVYDRSCAIGPWIVIGAQEEEARKWEINISISRNGREVFTGSTSVGQIKRSFDELGGYLFRSQTFLCGAILSTGTGIVPGDDFTLAENDRIKITIGGIGTLENTVIVV